MKAIAATRVNIREFTEKDLTTFANYRSNPKVARYQSWTTYSIEDAKQLYQSMKSQPFGTLGGWFQLAIASKSTDELLGDIAVHFVDKEQLEIGFTMAPDNQRKGIAFEAVSAFIDHAFNTLKIHRITATTDTLNTASINLLEKLTFRREAHFIENIFFKGTWGSEFQYALLNHEWK